MQKKIACGGKWWLQWTFAVAAVLAAAGPDLEEAKNGPENFFTMVSIDGRWWSEEPSPLLTKKVPAVRRYDWCHHPPQPGEHSTHTIHFGCEAGQATTFLCLGEKRAHAGGKWRKTLFFFLKKKIRAMCTACYIDVHCYIRV